MPRAAAQKKKKTPVKKTTRRTQRGGSAASDAVMAAVPPGAPAPFDNRILPDCAGRAMAGGAWGKKKKAPKAKPQRGGFFNIPLTPAANAAAPVVASVPAPAGLPSANGYYALGGMDPGASVHAPQLTFAARYPACLSGALIGPSGLAQAGGAKAKAKAKKAVQAGKAAAVKAVPCDCEGGKGKRRKH
jgi:hypothetical protein